MTSYLLANINVDGFVRFATNGENEDGKILKHKEETKMAKKKRTTKTTKKEMSAKEKRDMYCEAKKQIITMVFEIDCEGPDIAKDTKGFYFFIKGFVTGKYHSNELPDTVYKDLLEWIDRIVFKRAFKNIFSLTMVDKPRKWDELLKFMIDEIGSDGCD